MRYRYEIKNLEQLMEKYNLKGRDIKGINVAVITKIKNGGGVFKKNFELIKKKFGKELEYKKEVFRDGVKLGGTKDNVDYKTVLEGLKQLRERKGIKIPDRPAFKMFTNSSQLEKEREIQFENEKSERRIKQFGQQYA